MLFPFRQLCARTPLFSFVGRNHLPSTGHCRTHLFHSIARPRPPSIEPLACVWTCLENFSNVAKMWLFGWWWWWLFAVGYGGWCGWSVDVGSVWLKECFRAVIIKNMNLSHQPVVAVASECERNGSGFMSGKWPLVQIYISYRFSINDCPVCAAYGNYYLRVFDHLIMFLFIFPLFKQLIQSSTEDKL